MVVAEAGAMGTPAILSNIPGPIDAIDDGIAAYTVEPANTKDLIEKMNKIISANLNEMATNAHEFVKAHFDSRVLCEKILERKRNLLGIDRGADC